MVIMPPSEAGDSCTVVKSVENKKKKKKRTECDFSESHAHKMVPGGLVELFHQQTHHVT